MKRTPTRSLSTEQGKLPPSAIELENAVLGALLLESGSFEKVENILTEKDFYSPANQLIFKTIANLATRRHPVDMLTVTRELKSMGELDTVGGAYHIAYLSSLVGSSSHIEYHARAIKDKSQARRLIHILSETKERAYDETEDIGEVMEALEKSFTELTTEAFGSLSVNMPEALREAREKAVTLQQMHNLGVTVAIPTGLSSLDEIFAGGWKSPDLVVIGARPSMGKTQHALSFSKAAATQGKHVLFASIEMTSAQLINRYLLEDERIDGYHLRSGQMSAAEWYAFDEMMGKLWNMNLHIAADHNIRNLSNIKSEARRLKRKGELDLLVIDYLGLIKTNQTFSNRYQEIGYITGELKNLAKELDIPVILLSQLSRPVKGLTVKEPQLEDLRESGDIEQDADIVLFIHKPDYYEPSAVDSAGTPWQGRGKILIAKYREGARNNSVIFYHDRRYKKIGDKAFTEYSHPF